MLHNQQCTPPFRFITKESLLISVYCNVTVIICKMPEGIKYVSFDSTIIITWIRVCEYKEPYFYRTE